jgi:hypothetical protein
VVVDGGKDIRTIADLTPDPRNANRGTERGTGMVERSLRQYGAGRSILTDRNGVVIAGNKTLEQAAALGLDVAVVRTRGDRLVVVQREDLDLATDAAAKELAVADNRSSEVGLEWDASVLESLADEVDLSGLFFDDELDRLLGRLADFDPAAEWGGMPAFHQDDLMPDKQVVVNFASAEDVAAFAELVGQSVTMATKSIWYPAQPAGRFRGAAYTEANDDAA